MHNIHNFLLSYVQKAFFTVWIVRSSVMYGGLIFDMMISVD